MDDIRRQFDLAVEKARLFDELLDTLERITTDEAKHPVVLDSLEVALRVAKLRRRCAEEAVQTRVYAQPSIDKARAMLRGQS